MSRIHAFSAGGFYRPRCTIINSRRLFRLLTVLLGAVLTAGCGEQRSVDRPSETEAGQPVVSVRTAPLHRGRIDRTLKVYGMVIPAADKVRTFSVPFESVIAQEWVNAGEEVEANARLLTLKPSPDALLQLEKARIELGAAQEQLALVRERLRLKLATKQNLVAAESRLDQASRRVQSLTRRGIGKTHEIRAAATGIVFRIDVRQGEIAAAGAPLLQTVDRNQLMVRLGVEPEDIGAVREGQSVRMKPVHNPAAKPMEGRIHTLTHLVDPQTRLVTVLVQPATADGLLLNDYIEGRIVLQSKQALLAPHAALLPAGKAYRLFTVKNGRAIEHRVRKGLQTDAEVEIIGEGLQADEPVVTVGNYELENDGAVRVESIR